MIIYTFHFLKSTDIRLFKVILPPTPRSVCKALCKTYESESLQMRPESSTLTHFPADSPLDDPADGHSPNLEITDMKKILGLEKVLILY